MERNCSYLQDLIKNILADDQMQCLQKDQFKRTDSKLTYELVIGVLKMFSRLHTVNGILMKFTVSACKFTINMRVGF